MVCMVFYGMVWDCIVWYGMYGMAWYGVVWCGIVLYGMYGMVWCGIVLYCMVCMYRDYIHTSTHALHYITL